MPRSLSFSEAVHASPMVKSIDVGIVEDVEECDCAKAKFRPRICHLSSFLIMRDIIIGTQILKQSRQHVTDFMYQLPSDQGRSTRLSLMYVLHCVKYKGIT